MDDFQRDVRIKRKLFSVYTVFFLCGLILLLWGIMILLVDLDLWPLGSNELWFVFFMLIFSLVLLRLMFYIPFIFRSLHRSLKPYSLSIPLITFIIFLISSLSVLVPLFMDPLRKTRNFLELLVGILAGVFGLTALVCGVYGIRKFRKKEWKAVNAEKENLAGIRGPAKTMYWIYLLSGFMIVFFWIENALIEAGYWPELFNYQWSVRLASILTLLLLATPLVLIYHFWFLIYVVRNFRSVPSLSIPLVLLGLYFISMFLSGWYLVQFSVHIYGTIALISGVYGLYTFKTKFNTSGKP